MEIYLLEQDINNEYDTYDSAVVIAENEQDAKTIHPCSRVICEKDGRWIGENPDEWIPFDRINEIKVTHIGKANDEQKRGVVLASFNAG